MTLLGKILVFVSVMLSFVMLSWALMLFTNRIDWSATPAKEGKPEGVMVGRKKRVEAAYASLNLSEDRWREARNGSAATPTRPARDGLLTWEKRLADDRAWYAVQLKDARTGPGGDKMKPIMTVQLKDGQVVPDPKNGNRPTLVPAEPRKAKADDPPQPLYSPPYYEGKLVEVTQQIEAEQTRFQDLVKKETELTERAIGKPGMKGLRARIIDEQQKNARVDEEAKDLAGRKTNSRVEIELLLTRRDQLERRIDELQKWRAGQE